MALSVSLYRAIDSNGDTVEFLFSKARDLKAAKRFIRKALARHLRDQSDAMINQPLPSTMKALNVLLDDRFLRHEAHMWLLNGNADCLGIVAVIPLALQEPLHILRRDDLHSMRLSLKSRCQ